MENTTLKHGLLGLGAFAIYAGITILTGNGPKQVETVVAPVEPAPVVEVAPEPTRDYLAEAYEAMADCDVLNPEAKCSHHAQADMVRADMGYEAAKTYLDRSGKAFADMCSDTYWNRYGKTCRTFIRGN